VGLGTITPATALDVMGTTTTTNLQLTGIANSAKPNVLMYDPTTKAVSYGPASSSTPTITTTSVTNQEIDTTNRPCCVQTLQPGFYTATLKFELTEPTITTRAVIVELYTQNVYLLERVIYAQNSSIYVKDTASCSFQITSTSNVEANLKRTGPEFNATVSATLSILKVG
jgi:nanoRNase/pAp phosphatase (c-di-AMP/oligoRNAs hydrolase)